MRDLRCAPFIALPLLVAACGAPSSPHPSTSDRRSAQAFAIVNGTEDSGHPTVGKVLTATTLCTGTLIGHRTVLTAAHCIHVGDPHVFEVEGVQYSAVQAIRHSGYDPQAFGVNDLGIILLDKTPTGVGFSRVFSRAVSFGESVTLVGFGVTEQGGKDSGVKRRGQNRVLWKDAMNYAYYTTWGTWAQVCSGDSGGPSFASIGGQDLLVGVHSYTKGCDWGGYDMRSDAYIAWIEQISQGDVATERHDPPPPPDTTIPKVTIVSPQSGATLESDLDVHAEVSDDGTIFEVQMYLDGSLTHSVSAPPYHFFVGMLSSGPHQVRVVARDDAGNEGQATIDVSVGAPAPQPPHDTSPPSVVITFPAPGARISSSFDLRVEATDDVRVEGVALLRNGQVVDGIGQAPYLFHLTGMPSGPLTLEVRARDVAGNIGRAEINLQVDGVLAPTPEESGGCAVAAAGPAAPPPLLGFLVLLFWVRRVSRERSP